MRKTNLARAILLGSAATLILAMPARAQTAEETGLTRAQMKDLGVAWVVAFPQTPTMRSQPVIVGDTITTTVTLAEKYDEKRRMRFTIESKNQHGEIVLTGVDLTSWGGDLDGAPRLLISGKRVQLGELFRCEDVGTKREQLRCA